MKVLQKWGEILILISQIGLALLTLTHVVFDIRNTPINNYIFIGLVIFLVIAKVINLKGFKYILLGFLLIGTCNLLATSAFNSYAQTGLSWENGFAINLSFDIFYFLLLIFFIVIHSKDIMKYLEKTSQEVDSQKEKPSENYLNKYYDELKNKDNVYLENILSTRERWQKEYVLAAEQILEERKI
jgi:hypothetical protein